MNELKEKTECIVYPCYTPPPLFIFDFFHSEPDASATVPRHREDGEAQPEMGQVASEGGGKEAIHGAPVGRHRREHAHLRRQCLQVQRPVDGAAAPDGQEDYAEELVGEDQWGAPVPLRIRWKGNNLFLLNLSSSTRYRNNFDESWIPKSIIIFTDCEQILSHKLCHVINEFYGTGPWWPSFLQ